MEIVNIETDSHSKEEISFLEFCNAVNEKNDDIINVLIKKGDFLDKCFPCLHEATCLHVVAKRGTIKIAAEICKLGLDVNIQGHYNETPIFCAVRNCAEMVKVFIENGADVNFRSARGETPLHHAVKQSAEIVKLLLNNGAKADVVCYRNVSLLHESLHSGSEETVRIILNAILSQVQDDYKEVEKEDVMKTLLKNKSVLNIVGKDYPLLVLFAAKIGDDIFKLTLDDIRQSLCFQKLETNQSGRHIYRRYVPLEPKELNCQGYFDRTALHYAVRKQLPEIVEFLLKAGADVNCITRRGFTPLYYAAGFENKKICEILLNFGADVNLKKGSMGDPLYQVCGNKKSSHHLQADDNGYYYEEHVDRNIEVPVFNTEIIKLFLLKGAHPNMYGRDSTSPFVRACKRNNLECLKILFKHSANLHTNNSTKRIDLYFAAQNNYFEIVHFLLEELDSDTRSKLIDSTLLFLIISKPTQCSNMIEYLLNRGANVNQVKFGKPAMDYAIKCSSKVLKLFLSKGKKFNSVSLNDVTLLHEALYSSSEENVRIIVNKLISDIDDNYEETSKTEEIVNIIWKYKAVLNIAQDDYALLIFFAAKVGDEKNFKLILNDVKESLLSSNKKKIKRVKLSESDERTKRFASTCSEVINCKGKLERTALDYAVQKELPEVVRFLLKAGANVNCKSLKYLTPLHYAAALQNEEICKILMSFGAKVNPNPVNNLGSPLDQVCDHNTLERELKRDETYFSNLFFGPKDYIFNSRIAKLLLDNGANPHVSGSDNATPFFNICRSGNLDLMNIIFQNTANLHIRDKRANSVLHHAVASNSLEVVDFLLKKGVDIDIRNNDNYTPIFEVVEIEMIEYLVDRGANVNARDNKDATALHFSVFSDTPDTVECLLELGANVHLVHNVKSYFGWNYRYLGDSRKLLISFIALKKYELDKIIYCYFDKDWEKLSEVWEYFEKCKLEVEKLKSRKMIQGSKMSFYDFLTGTFYNAVQLAENAEIRKIFRFCKYKSEFPCYALLLERRFDRVLALRDAVNKTEIFLTNYFSMLPNLAVRGILNFLCSFDFRKFGTALLKNESLVEEQAIPDLQFKKYYKRAKIVGIQEDGIMVSLFSNMTPVLLPNSQMRVSNEYLCALNSQIGDVVPVQYLGRYPESGLLRLVLPFDWDDPKYSELY